MSAEEAEVVPKIVPTDGAADPKPVARAAYEPPRIEKRRSVARVTLVSGMGQTGVGVIGRRG